MANPIRNGKARLAAGTKEVFERLGTSSQVWGNRIAAMLNSIKLNGNVFATKGQRLEPVKQKRNQRVINLSPQPG